MNGKKLKKSEMISFDLIIFNECPVPFDPNKKRLCDSPFLCVVLNLFATYVSEGKHLLPLPCHSPFKLKVLVEAGHWAVLNKLNLTPSRGIEEGVAQAGEVEAAGLQV